LGPADGVCVAPLVMPVRWVLKGMFEGNLGDGGLEIGQVGALINDIKPAAEIVREIWIEFNETLIAPIK